MAELPSRTWIAVLGAHGVVLGWQWMCGRPQYTGDEGCGLIMALDVDAACAMLKPDVAPAPLMMCPVCLRPTPYLESASDAAKGGE